MSNFSCRHFTEWYNLAGDVFSYTITVIVTSSISVVPSIILNVAIFIGIFRTASLHTPQHIYMCNLAVSNIGLSCLGIPVSYAWKLLERYHHDDQLVCFFAFFSYTVCSFFCGAAFFMVTAASVDRYLALTLHLNYITMVTNTRTIIACMGLWVVSLLIALLLLIGQKVYSLVTSMGILFFMATMGYCYLKIFYILRRHHNQIQSQLNAQAGDSKMNLCRYRKSVSGLAYVLVIYIVFYTPYLASQAVIALDGVSVASLKLWNVGVLLLFVNSFINPLFHCLKFEEVRSATWRVITRQAS